MTATRVVADRMRDLRVRRGWSAERLAEEMTKAGVQWERAVVTKLENGRRQAVSVAELLALARVLDVAPVHLLVPTDNQTRMVVVPNEDPHTAGRIREWVRGRNPLPGTDKRFYFSEVPEEEWEEPQPSQAEIRNLLRRIGTQEGSDDG